MSQTQHEAVPGHHHTHEHDHSHGSRGWARIRHALVPHSHDHIQTIQGAEEASAVGIRAAWISLAGMALTASLQIVIVWISGSVALLADTLHNLGHLVTTIPLIIAFRIGRRPATRRYSHGFQRAEDLVGLLVASMRVVLRRLMDGAEPETLALVEKTAAAVPGVVQVREARVRWSGHRLLAECGVVLDGELSVAEAALIVRQVEGRLTSQVPHLERAAIGVIADPAG